MSCENTTDMYHYKTSGLDYIYLANGFDIHETGHGRGVSIHDLFGLHKAISTYLVRLSRDLTGQEFRFLRVELDMSQKALGTCLDKSDQTIAKWEKGQVKIPREADLLLRNIYMERVIGENPKVSDLIDQLNDLDNAIHEMKKLCFAETDMGWAEAA